MVKRCYLYVLVSLLLLMLPTLAQDELNEVKMESGYSIFTMGDEFKEKAKSLKGLVEGIEANLLLFRDKDGSVVVGAMVPGTNETIEKNFQEVVRSVNETLWSDQSIKYMIWDQSTDKKKYGPSGYTPQKESSEEKETGDLSPADLSENKEGKSLGHIDLGNQRRLSYLGEELKGDAERLAEMSFNNKPLLKSLNCNVTLSRRDDGKLGLGFETVVNDETFQATRTIVSHINESLWKDENIFFVIYDIENTNVRRGVSAYVPKS